MSTKKTYCLMALIFLLGILLGSMVTKNMLISKIKKLTKATPPEMIEIAVETIDNRIGLESEQKDKLREIFKIYQPEMTKVRNEMKPKMTAIMDNLRKEFSTVLSSEQLAEFKKMFDEMRNSSFPFPPIK